MVHARTMVAPLALHLQIFLDNETLLNLPPIALRYLDPETTAATSTGMLRPVRSPFVARLLGALGLIKNSHRHGRGASETDVVPLPLVLPLSMTKLHHDTNAAGLYLSETGRKSSRHRWQGVACVFPLNADDVFRAASEFSSLHRDTASFTRFISSFVPLTSNLFVLQQMQVV